MFLFWSLAYIYISFWCLKTWRIPEEDNCWTWSLQKVQIQKVKKTFLSFKDLLGDINNDSDDSRDEICNNDPFASVGNDEYEQNIDGGDQHLLQHIENILQDPMCDQDDRNIDGMALMVSVY